MRKLGCRAGALLMVSLCACPLARAEAPPCRCGPDGERMRIEGHLLAVEAWLRMQDIADLTPSQRDAREAALDTLHDYAEGGVFPKNPGTLAPRVPYFFDGSGVPCAVAELVLASGATELAVHIEATSNTAYLPDMHEPRLASWAEANGFTPHELAMIQPDYCREDDANTCLACETPIPPMSGQPCTCTALPDGAACRDPADGSGSGRCLNSTCLDCSGYCDDGDSDTVDSCDPDIGCAHDRKVDAPGASKGSCAASGSSTKGESSWLLALIAWALATTARRSRDGCIPTRPCRSRRMKSEPVADADGASAPVSG
jgi:hypothetical protein